MSSDKSLELFDLASQEPKRCWSFHVWKIRPVLTYKNLQYTTTWLDHNNLGPTLKDLGVPSHPPGGFPWTVPTVRFPDGSITMESTNIAAKIEELYPHPPLYIDEELQREAEQTVYSFCFPLFALYMPRTAKDIVVPSALAAFKATREMILGATLEDLAKTPEEVAWNAAKPGLEKFKEFLTTRKLDDGPFIRGSQISFADFILAAVIKSFKQSGEDFYEGIVSYDPSIKALYLAMVPYLERED